MTAVRTLDYLARASGAVALLLGIALWTGRLSDRVTIHMAFGLAIVAALFVLSVLVLLRTRQMVLAVSGIALAGFTVALGLGQTQLLAGDLHWIVEIAHLILGLSAVAMAAVLARTLKGT